MILILLTVLGIVFKDKLRPLLMRVKSKFRKGGGKSQPSRFGRRPPGSPPGTLTMPERRFGERKVLPSSHQPVRRNIPIQRPRPRQSGEVDDVLKKLKEMSK